MSIWSDVIPAQEIEIYQQAGFGRRAGLGRRPALLIIDVQYRTVGTLRQPIGEAMKEYPTACGEAGWQAVDACGHCWRYFVSATGRCCIRMSRSR